MRLRTLSHALILAALLAALTVAPASASPRRVPFGFFGTVIDPAVTVPSTEPVLDQQMGLMARSGIESVRSNIFWSATEPAQGVFDWRQPDKLVLATASHGMALMPIIEFTPKWATSSPNDPAFSNFPPAHESAFAGFMTAVVDRYGPHGTFWNLHSSLRRYAVRSYQIWNEPAGTYDWRAKPWPSTYLGLLRTGYKAIHKADPGAKVVSGAVVALNLTNLQPWTEARALYRLGGRRFFDVLAVNAFTYSDSVLSSVTRSVEVVNRVRAVMRQFGDGHKPIWVTEVTWPASLHKIKSRYYDGFETTASGQAKRLRAYYNYIASHRRSAGISRAFWYTWASSYNPVTTNGITPTFTFSGLVKWRPGTAFHPLPVLVAYEREAARWEGCRKSANAHVCR